MLSKRDLQRIEELLDRKFDQKFDQKFDEKFDRKFDERFEELRLYISDQILTFKDQILHEIVVIREELTVLNGQISRSLDCLDNHDKRIASLEASKHTHPALA